MIKKINYADSVWKDIIEQYFPQFLEFFYKNIYQDIDFKKGYEFLDKEFQQIVKDNEIGNRYADKLVKVWLKDGSEKWLLIHVEVQGSVEKNFSERLYIYNYRIFDKYKKEVISLAILTDENKKFRPEKYEIKRWGFHCLYKFPIIKIIDYKSKLNELEKSLNPFSIAVCTHLRLIEARDDYNMKYFWKLHLVKAMYKKGYKKPDILNLYRFIDWLIILNKNLEIKFKNELIKFEEEKKMPYITNIEKLAAEKIAQNMISKGMDKKTIAELTGLSEKEINKLAKNSKKAA